MSVGEKFETAQIAVNPIAYEYIDLSKTRDDDSLVALKSNVKRVVHAPQSASNALNGSMRWNNIEPPSINHSIKNLRLNFEVEMVAVLGENDNTAVLRANNLNKCIRDLVITINGQNITDQPYIISQIKEQYCPETFQENALVFQDKYSWITVSSVVTQSVPGDPVIPGYTTTRIKYKCSTPLYSSILEAEDLQGIYSLSIAFDYNLRFLFTIGAETVTSLSIAENTSPIFSISFDDTTLTQPKPMYTMLCKQYQYFYGNSDAKLSNINLHDGKMTKNVRINNVTTTPSRIYLGICKIPTQTNPKATVENLSYTFENIDYRVQDKSNCYLTTKPNDVYHVSKSAGLLTEYQYFAGFDLQESVQTTTQPTMSLLPVAAINLLNYDSIVSDASMFRFNVDFNITVNRNSAVESRCRDFVVYEYPALLTLSTDYNNLNINVGTTLQNLTESTAMDIYLDLFESIGLMSGGGMSGAGFMDKVRGFIKRLRDRKTVSQILGTIGKIGTTVAPALGFIPGVGPIASTIAGTVGNVAGKIGDAAGKAGYSVNLF